MVNLSIDKSLVQEARERFRINLSAFCERELLRKIRHLRRQEQKNEEQGVPSSSIIER